MSLPTPPRVAAVLLAAGAGQRLGGVAKPLLRVDGLPLLARLWRQLHAAGVRQGVVVSGAHAERLRHWIDLVGLPDGWQLVHNEDPAAGQSGSVRLGVLALLDVPDWDVALMLPCDLPLLDAADLRPLIDAFGAPLDARYLRPESDGRPGHPVLLSRAAALALRDAGPPADCRSQMAQHPQQVVHVAVPNDHGVFDLDTPDDLQRLRERTGWTVSV